MINTTDSVLLLPLSPLSASTTSVSVSWSWTPVTQGASMHYQMDVSGKLTPYSICVQNALPGQPANTCVVVFSGATTCYT